MVEQYCSGRWRWTSQSCTKCCPTTRSLGGNIVHRCNELGIWAVWWLVCSDTCHFSFPHIASRDPWSSDSCHPSELAYPCRATLRIPKSIRQKVCHCPHPTLRH